MTNNGNMVRELEHVLREYLKLPYLCLLNNGTTALMVALKAMGLKGEVITTPFTFPATVHAISWLGLEPVFCDVDPDTMMLCPESVEHAIGPNTSAILGVHLFGCVCDVEALESLGRQYHLKVIFDAAHSFCTQIDDRPIGMFGDATMFSLHATKLFHTAEGGALAVKDAELERHIIEIRNFGILDEYQVGALGINAKMNELQAAFGLEILPLIADEIERRKTVRTEYQKRLSDIPGVALVNPPQNVFNNQQFLTVRISKNSPIGSAEDVCSRLRKERIHARRYFRPLVSQYAHYRNLPSAAPANLPAAYKVSEESLCLPFFGNLSEAQIKFVCDVFKGLY